MTTWPQEFIGAFKNAGGDELVGTTRLAFFADFLEATFDRSNTGDPADTEVAWGFESLGVAMLREAVDESEVIQLFNTAFSIRSALAVQTDTTVELHDLWMILASGTLAQRQPELRLLLGRLKPPAEPQPNDTWDQRVWRQCVRSAYFVARRNNSWTDINDAVTELQALAAEQRESEHLYLEARAAGELTPDHCKLLGLYHLAEAITLVGTYARSGEPPSVLASLQRHGEHARLLLGASGNIDLERVGESLEAFTTGVVRSSIWYNTRRLSDAAREFAQTLAGPDLASPVTELWWSQRTALRESLLDPFKSAISVQMPTSAGKTLLAEFSIVQALALNPDSTVAYVVPTRALVNQITRRLRADLLNTSSHRPAVTVEAAVPAFELDPAENAMLTNAPQVLVATPEKLDLLVRSSHPAVANLSLVVVDEAHHLADEQRGPRLELLLATLKHERGSSCRFLLLTPFLPNGQQLAGWLGDSDGVAIQLDWTPSEQLRALGKWRRHKGQWIDTLQLLPSITTQPDVWNDVEFELGPATFQPPARKRTEVSASLARRLSNTAHGGTLILTRGPAVAETRAVTIAQSLPDTPAEPGSLMNAVKQYVASELGENYALLSTLNKGVAFHHAGMPPEVRSLVELLLEHGDVRVVAGTTTLAQGVNFPLSSVIVEALTVPQGRGKSDRAMRYSEFWNVAGRAGRALKDSVGLVVYPAIDKKQENEFRKFLEGEAVEVVSALARVISTLDERSTDYGLALVRDNPALSNFLQYLTHALRVAGFETAQAQIEDLLRSSLAFHSLRLEDRATAERLVRWCRNFMAAHQNAKLVPIADTTGLSLPSINLLAARAETRHRSDTFWHPENLFGSNLEPLTQVVELLGQLPELSLAPSDDAGPMNAERIAGVLRDWVQGRSLPEIADSWFGSSAKDLQSAGRYLFREVAGQLPWGIGALQTVTLSGSTGDNADAARQAPALAFYGVNDPQALPMRMIGVPRMAAGALGSRAPAFDSFESARSWVADLDTAVWNEAAGSRGISGAVLRQIWREVGGSAA